MRGSPWPVADNGLVDEFEQAYGRALGTGGGAAEVDTAASVLAAAGDGWDAIARRTAERVVRRCVARGWGAADLVRMAGRELTPQHHRLAMALEQGPGLGRFAGEERLDRFSAATVLVELLCLYGRLPGITALTPPRSGPFPGEPKILGRIRALLAKAESTGFPEEAEALSAKAQQLMTRHRIDEALLSGSDLGFGGRGDGGTGGPGSGGPGAEGQGTDGQGTDGLRGGGPGSGESGGGPGAGGSEGGGSGSGGSGAGRPGARRIGVDRPYESAKALLLDAVAAANRCEAVWSADFGFSTVVGHETDLDAVEILYASLLVQADRALHRGPSRRRDFRESFLIAYAARIRERLTAATAEEVSARDDAPDLLPVLAARDLAVRNATRRLFPATTTTRLKGRDAQGWQSGETAADRARLHRP